MVYILSKIDADTGKEIFVGQYPSKGKIIEVIEQSAQLEILAGNEATTMCYSSPKYKVREMGDSPFAPRTTTTYLVNSFSDWNTAYEVEVEDDTGQAISCTCGDHTHRGSFCKHMRVVNNYGTKGLRLAAPKPAVIPTAIPDNSAQAVIPRKPEMPQHHRYITVASESDWRKTYLVGVDVNGFVYSCNCPDFEYRQHKCKHMQKATKNSGLRVRDLV